MYGSFDTDSPWQQELEVAHRMWIDRLLRGNAKVVPLIADGSTPDGQRRALSEAEHHPQVAPLLDQVLSGRKRTEDIDL